MGLTTALLLARDGKYSVTIIAKHMPGDYDIEYAVSPRSTRTACNPHLLNVFSLLDCAAVSMGWGELPPVSAAFAATISWELSLAASKTELSYSKTSAQSRN